MSDGDSAEGPKRNTPSPRARSSAPPHEDDSLIDRMLPENLKRRIEAGVDSVLRDHRVKHIVGEFNLPKEIINHAKAQIDETKRTAIDVIARETREFLEKTNIADELAKFLTQVSLQVELRFVPNEKTLKEQPEDQVAEGAESPSAADDESSSA